MPFTIIVETQGLRKFIRKNFQKFGYLKLVIIDNLSQISNKNFFSIIIGSGPAGLTLALELEKKKINSVLIEAGSNEYNAKELRFMEGNLIGNSYNSHTAISAGRLRQFGGTSGHWGGACNLFDKNDFKEWPIKKTDLEPYILKAKKILNLKHKFFKENLSENFNIYNLVFSKVRFGDKYFNHVKKSKFIYLSLNTVFINFNGNNGYIESITCYKKRYINLKANYYILNCGGIENPRLLLWSQFKKPELFNHRLPIGNFFMDHPYHRVGEAVIIRDKFFSYFKNNNIVNTPIFSCSKSMYLSMNPNFLKQKKILNSGIYINFSDIKINDDFLNQLRCAAPKYFRKLTDTKKINDINHISIDLVQEEPALYENKIVLGKNLDPLNIPLVEMYASKSEKLKNSAAEIINEFANFLLNNDIGRAAIKEYVFNKNDYEIHAVGGHHIGTTRIGESVKDSVVDKNLKVHGFKNLFIGGSSIFRTGGHCHPTHTIVQFALRLSDHLSKLVI